ncbi:hypothetical protein SAMN05444161_3475 [Rhizobiales bacterium GAS191]|nr:hypothetical protein SAMN05519103_02642 [Rhizobiales bacterium GAS113]SED56128.1 hypothetical protein SAMN05444161_3475 [Rhizobiales bacterium GAS191]
MGVKLPNLSDCIDAPLVRFTNVLPPLLLSAEIVIAAGYDINDPCLQRQMTLIIAVTGCRRTVARMEAVRATWASHIVADVDVLYFVGSGDALVPEWLTELDAPDDYASLPIKIHRIHQWLSGRAFDWVFKCDDDTYVVVDRLLAELPRLRPKDFLGSASFFPHFASGGAGYLMHREASNCLAREPVPCPAPEDVYFTQRLRSLGYTFRSTPRLRCDSRYGDEPTRDNDIISCHWLDPLGMRRLHDAFLCRPRERIPAEAYRAVHAAWQGEVLLFDDGFFVGGASAPDGLWSVLGCRLRLRWFFWPEDVLDRTETGWRNDRLKLERLALHREGGEP